MGIKKTISFDIEDRDGDTLAVFEVLDYDRFNFTVNGQTAEATYGETESLIKQLAAALGKVVTDAPKPDPNLTFESASHRSFGTRLVATPSVANECGGGVYIKVGESGVTRGRNLDRDEARELALHILQIVDGDLGW